MQARSTFEVFRIVGIAVFATVLGMAQGMCIPDPLTSSAIRGHVYFEVDGKRKALSDVVIELSPYGYDRPVVKKAATDFEGSFEMPNVRPGHYYLTAKHAAVIGITVEIHLKRAKNSDEGERGIEFVLRNDPSKACGGATVELASKPAREQPPKQRFR